MSWKPDKEQRAFLVGCGLALAVILFAVLAKYSINPATMRTVHETILEQKRELSAIRIDLLKSVDMEKNAVMALTDQESMEYADQSRAASASVDRHLATLRALVEDMPTERQLLDNFAACWTEMGKIDQVILQLAVANTNLKAMTLSRDQGGASMQRFEQAMEAVRAATLGNPEERQIAALASRAMVAGLKLYTQHGPHIIEPDAARMDQLEARMNAEEAEAMQSLAALGELAGKGNAETVIHATTAFAEFVAVTNQVVQLSRLNSNIKSLELSMGRKRAIAAQCDDALAALQESVHQKTFKATK